jgi:hypothetical protein
MIRKAFQPFRQASHKRDVIEMAIPCVVLDGLTRRSWLAPAPTSRRPDAICQTRLGTQPKGWACHDVGQELIKCTMWGRRCQLRPPSWSRRSPAENKSRAAITVRPSSTRRERDGCG